MMRSPDRSTHSSCPSAFSLVEVALAIAVIAVAFVSLMALLPMGLTQFREAMDTTIGAQIFQRVIGDVQQTDFETLIAGASERRGGFYALPTRYFDEQGNEIAPAQGQELAPADREGIVYHVRVRGAEPGLPDVALHQNRNVTSLPGGVRFNPRDSTFLTVQVAKNPANRAIAFNAELLWDEATAARMGIPVRAYPAIVTRNGYRHPGLETP